MIWIWRIGTWIGFVLFAPVWLNAQITVTIGADDIASDTLVNPGPFATYNKGVNYQSLMHAEELWASGMVAGYIQSIGYKVKTPTVDSIAWIIVKIAQTDSNAFSGNTNIGNTANIASWHIELDHEVQAGWNVITFDSGYYWNGQSNLIIETCLRSPDYLNSVGHAGVYMHQPGFMASSVISERHSYLCSPFTLSDHYMERPVIQLTHVNDPEPPIANFQVVNSFSCADSICFTNYTYGAQASYVWDFGDGQSDTMVHPCHTYTNSGTYQVKLIVTNPYGVDSIVKMVPITILDNQLPLVPVCTPQTQQYCCGYGIASFQLAAIQSQTLDAVEGYTDHTCLDGTSLIAGKKYHLSVSSIKANEQYFKAWIDLDNDGQFDPITELVFSSNSKGITQSYLLLPTPMALNTALRLRVMSDTVPPAPCSNPLVGQAEDYTLVIMPNTDPPETNFGVSDTFSCDGTVAFTDSTENLPDNWFWDFGDGNNSIAQHPTHTYTTSGWFTVKLVTTNPFGADSLEQNQLVHIKLENDPVPAQCIPLSMQPQLGGRIDSIVFHSLVFGVNQDTTGYFDQSCQKYTTVVEGHQYPLQLQLTNSIAYDVRAWIDLNNDGIFDTLTETILQLDSVSDVNSIVTIPQGIVFDTALRMRIIADTIGTNPLPCSNILNGQAVDITAFIATNLDAPMAQFVTSDTVACDLNVQFTDASFQSPTSWAWDFGDGDTSMLQHPLHTYPDTGQYTVRLITCNSFGCDTVIKPGFITVTSAYGNPVTINCTPTVTAPNGNIGIDSISLNTLQLSSQLSAAAPYEALLCQTPTELQMGQTYAMHVKTSFFGNPCDVKAWIDWDNNGNFEVNDELVFESIGQVDNHWDTLLVPSQVTTVDTPLRMRVIQNVGGSWGPCDNPAQGQIEDYTVVVQPSPVPPIADLRFVPLSLCNDSIAFFDESTFYVTSWFWQFGDGAISLSPNPVHAYQDTGKYTITLIVSNPFGADTLVWQDTIDVAGVSHVQTPASCTPFTFNPIDGRGIYQVHFAGISHASGSSLEEYQDFTCLAPANVKEGLTYPVNIVTGNAITEQVKVWIDFNNNGTFSADELVFEDQNGPNHSGMVFIPGDAITDLPIRMRVYSDNAGANIDSACINANVGQVEDYGVIIHSVALPVADFMKLTTDPCTGETTFADSSEQAIQAWQWDFGDGMGNDTIASPTYQYAVPDTYQVTLKVQNIKGVDSITQSIPVTFLYADFAIDTDVAYVNVPVNITNASQGANKYTWHFGDGSTSPAFEPTYAYSDTGEYQITLIAENETAGCADTLDSVFVNVQLNDTTSMGRMESKAYEAFQLFPNPAGEVFWIKTNHSRSAAIHISCLNLQGECLYSNTLPGKESLHRLSLKQLPPGMYFIHVSDQYQQEVFKLVHY